MMKLRLLLILLIAPFVFAGCGGGGGGGSSTPDATASTGIVAGKIDGFGSVHVANRVLETDSNTEVEIGDDSGFWDDSTKGGLKVGHIAVVDEDNGRATKITVDENVKGPVDSVNPDLVVMGQTILQDAQTIVDNSCPASFQQGDVLEVFGFVQTSGDILARLIECKGDISNTTVDRYSLIGEVSNFIIGGNSFDINGLSVDVSSAVIDDDMTAGDWNGLLVEVKDDNKTYDPLNNPGFLFATKLEPQDSLGDLVVPNQEFEIENLVTDISDLPGSFKMGDLTVVIPVGFSNFLFGTIDNIIVGAEIEVEGIIDSSHNLVAEKIKFEENSLRVQGMVTSVDSSNTITLLGGEVTVVIPSADAFEEDLSFGDLVAGSSIIEIEGFEDTSNSSTIIASEVKDASGDDKSFLRGPASNVTNNTVDILDVTVTFDVNTTEFHDHDGETNIGADAFFAQVVDGLTPVKARWDDFVSISDPVKELEIEDD